MKLELWVLDPEVPFTMIVSFPTGAAEEAVIDRVTFVAPLADSSTGLFGVNSTVIPDGAALVRLTGSPETCSAWLIPRTTTRV